MLRFSTISIKPYILVCYAKGFEQPPIPESQFTNCPGVRIVLKGRELAYLRNRDKRFITNNNPPLAKVQSKRYS